MLKINGLFPPLPTAFDANEDISVDRIKENIKWLCGFNLAGILILGSNGELVMLTEAEKEAVYAAAREAIPGNKLMIAGTAGQSTRETIRVGVLAAKKGANAALVLNPSYYKGQMTKEALVRFYHDVAEASEIPVIIYNMPANSGVDMDADTILSISLHPNIIGLKDSGGNLVKMGDIIRCAKPGFQVLAGSASFLLPALTMGAVGGILALANIAPQLCLDIYQSFLAGDIEKARSLQHTAIPVNTAVTRLWGVPALKAAMDYLGSYGGPVRRPLLPVGEEQKSAVIKLLTDNNIPKRK